MLFPRGNGDILAGAGTYLYFVDREEGYVRLNGPGRSGYRCGWVPEGDTAWPSPAMCSMWCPTISTPSTARYSCPGGSFIIPRPNSTAVSFCAPTAPCEDRNGGLDHHKTGADRRRGTGGGGPGNSGDYLFAADPDGTVYKISTADFSTAAETTVENGVNGMCSTPSGRCSFHRRGEARSGPSTAEPASIPGPSAFQAPRGPWRLPEAASTFTPRCRGRDSPW